MNLIQKLHLVKQKHFPGNSVVKSEKKEFYFMFQVQVHLYHSKHIILHEEQKNYIPKYKKSMIYKRETEKNINYK